MTDSNSITRRRALQLGALAGAGIALGRNAWAAESPQLPLIAKAIPASGEKISVVGLGTNAYGVSSAADLAARREVLRRMPELGSTVVDTAPSYGRSEEVIGELVEGLGNRNKLFFATKVTAAGDDIAIGKRMLEDSFRRLRTDHIELIEVHNLNGIDVLMPVLAEMKAAKRIKYTGVTTSRDNQHGALVEAMRKYQPDFIQVNYSLDDRESAAQILPLAQELKIAVLVNVPFGGRRGSLFSRVANTPLPAWAADIDVASWGQFFLKYVVSHPAVTCAIPGTTKVSHLEDNQRAARGRLPDAAMRKRMEAFWDDLKT